MPILETPKLVSIFVNKYRFLIKIRTSTMRRVFKDVFGMFDPTRVFLLNPFFASTKAMSESTTTCTTYTYDGPTFSLLFPALSVTELEYIMYQTLKQLRFIPYTTEIFCLQPYRFDFDVFPIQASTQRSFIVSYSLKSFL